MLEKKRSTEELIILALSSASTVCLLPFLAWRTIEQDWLVAALDLLAIMVAVGLFIHVYITRNVIYARWVLAILCAVELPITIALKGPAQIGWIYPAIIAMFMLLSPTIALMLSLTMISIIGGILWSQLNSLMYYQSLFSILATALFIYAFTNHMFRQQQILRQLSIKDPLTGVGNRRALEDKLLELMSYKRAHRDNTSTLILIDLDQFKDINDHYGHAIGDQILITFASLVNQKLRNNESLYRLGGEEFVITVANKNRDKASILAEEIRELVDLFLFTNSIHLTISIGIAESQAKETTLDWLGRADAAMYKAKGAGRNLCCVAA
ncbi:GGDEF domain-containing protein [Paraglaciecola sp.]|uniref:GGDEF domain-containing protein n=1 Tax=Paraglaciecola sp. TaxID=1920173 RepID=UPI0030F47C4A